MNWHDELDARLRREGHPVLELDSGNVIFVCANCERIRSVLFLTKDRWLCTACRNTGTERPTFIPLTKPS